MCRYMIYAAQKRDIVTGFDHLDFVTSGKDVSKKAVMR